MPILKDDIEKRSLVKEAVEVWKLVDDLMGTTDEDIKQTVFREVMTNIRGVSMRRGR